MLMSTLQINKLSVMSKEKKEIIADSVKEVEALRDENESLRVANGIGSAFCESNNGEEFPSVSPTSVIEPIQFVTGDQRVSISGIVYVLASNYNDTNEVKILEAISYMMSSS
ncbi:hypothetical protein Tco_1037968 [Tanacetum coccineum]